ncbi:MAG: cytochrome c peroxidase [Polyangiaceae bacterium]
MRNDRSAASARSRAHRVPAILLIATTTATFAAVVHGAPPAPPQQTQQAPAAQQPPATQAAAATPPKQPATPGVTSVQSVSNTGPASGGGEAPHGALPMTTQLSKIGELVRVAPGSVPAGVEPSFWKTIVPNDNAGNDARVALGRKLYFEPKLSKDGTVACATCHDVSRGFTDRRGTSEGIGDKLGRRNAPTTLNAAFFSSQFWDGRAATLEEQAKLPITNPIEMGQPDGNAAISGIKNDADYKKAFKDAYGRDVNFEDVGRAIAAFERTLIFIDAPFDRFIAGDTKAIDDDAKAGWVLYNGKGRCTACHQISSSVPIGSDNRFHNIGVSARHQDFEALAKKGLAAVAKDASKETLDKLALETDLSELGRFIVSKNRSEIGAFKTSQVRNVGITAPYMHDGSIATLWDVMDHYNKGGEANAFLDGGIEPLALTDKEVDQLVAFLFSLTDLRFDADNKAEFARQKKIAASKRPLRDEAAAMRKVLPFERRAEGKK